MQELNLKYGFEVRINGRKATEYNQTFGIPLKSNEVWIEGRKGSNYELYFQNKTRKRVLVVLSVDGIDVMDGKTASDKSRGYVVGPWGEVTIPGWLKDSEGGMKFQFQPEGSKANTTYVERLSEAGYDVDTRNQGVIGVMVFEEKESVVDSGHFQYVHHYHHYDDYYTNPYLPYIRPHEMWSGNGIVSGHNNYSAIGQNSLSYSASAASGPKLGSSRSLLRSAAKSDPFYDVIPQGLGTAQGEDVAFKTRNVTFERKPDPIWVGVINYDTIQGLRRRGVFVENSPKKAFPGYSSGGCVDLR